MIATTTLVMGTATRDKAVPHPMLGVAGITWTRTAVSALAVAVDSKMAVTGATTTAGTTALTTTPGASTHRKPPRRIGPSHCQPIKGWRSEYTEQRIGEGGPYRGFFYSENRGGGPYRGVLLSESSIEEKREVIFRGRSSVSFEKRGGGSLGDNDVFHVVL